MKKGNSKEKKNHFCQALTLAAIGRQQTHTWTFPSSSSSSSPTQLHLTATFDISPSSVLLKLNANTRRQQTEMSSVWVRYLVPAERTSARLGPCVKPTPSPHSLAELTTGEKPQRHRRTFWVVNPWIIFFGQTFVKRLPPSLLKRQNLVNLAWETNLQSILQVVFSWIQWFID